ncbi:hypothetical protein BU16DRAFT_350688 [Lophium mytilinum]|uniref:Uncharacterized protein n=1 Tax=Lophium mytilinum TaxID=390894 RepID=A0A6A6QY15_9PEZI|nr:hypothetical protein BU16DRAFT_350688 [Lophium mytilinum]
MIARDTGRGAVGFEGSVPQRPVSPENQILRDHGGRGLLLDPEGIRLTYRWSSVSRLGKQLGGYRRGVSCRNASGSRFCWNLGRAYRRAGHLKPADSTNHSSSTPLCMMMPEDTAVPARRSLSCQAASRRSRGRSDMILGNRNILTRRACQDIRSSFEVNTYGPAKGVVVGGK